MLTPSDLNAIREDALSHFLDFDVDERLLQHLLGDQIKLQADAVDWGWDDTLVRESIANLIAHELLGRPFLSYGETQGLDEAAQSAAMDRFVVEMHDAHDRWVNRRNEAAHRTP